MIKFGTPALVLAPMEGVTDAPMRALQGESGAFTYAVSEFVRVNDQAPPHHVFHRMVPELAQGAVTKSGLPVAVQILGGHPERMGEAALNALQCGAQMIDINFGCPAPTVNRHDGGATLLKFPNRIYDIVKFVRTVVPQKFTVSAKLRLGWSETCSIFENAKAAEEAGANWITIHGRTKVQGYQPPIQWEPIGKVREMLSIPVVANGDIWTLSDFKRCQAETGCEHFMLGRGAMANPDLPKQVARELGLIAAHEGQAIKTPEAWMPLIERFIHWSSFYPQKSPFYLVSRIKQWLNYAQKRGAIDWFDQVKRFSTIEEFQALV